MSSCWQNSLTDDTNTVGHVLKSRCQVGQGWVAEQNISRDIKLPWKTGVWQIEQCKKRFSDPHACSIIIVAHISKLCWANPGFHSTNGARKSDTGLSVESNSANQIRQCSRRHYPANRRGRCCWQWQREGWLTESNFFVWISHSCCSEDSNSWCWIGVVGCPRYWGCWPSELCQKSWGQCESSATSKSERYHAGDKSWRIPNFTKLLSTSKIAL